MDHRTSTVITFHHSIILKNYKRIRKLGEGNFSDVILIETDPDKRLIALKRLKINFHESPSNLLNEVKLLKLLDHPNIIKCYDYQKEMIRISIALEYCDDGDLSCRIAEANLNNYRFKESSIMKWISQLFLAIDYLHHHHILHRDIKPQNIFLMKNGLLKLGDFGIAKELQSDEDFTKTKLGTPYYLAPEICLGKPYSYPADIWMSGIVIYELLTLKKPFEEESLHGVVNKIVNQDAPVIEGDYNENLKQLVKKMLEKDPEKRISAKEILNTPFVAKEIEEIKNEYESYKKPENEKNHQISFQEYLNDKLTKGENSKEPDIMNQYSSLKNKENNKVLLRYNSLPTESFEISNHNINVGIDQEDNKNKRYISSNGKLTQEKSCNGEFINKTASHFEEFLQSKKQENTFISKIKHYSKISAFKKDIEKKFPALKEVNLSENFLESLFLKNKLEKQEFFTKINENCNSSLDNYMINLLYENYEQIISFSPEFQNNF